MIQNKKQSGKRARIKARVPKETIKAPIHHTTSPRMFSESCSSGCPATKGTLAKTVIAAAKAIRAAPSFNLAPADLSGDSQSNKINATLTGRISNMCVYRSSRSANTNEDIKRDGCFISNRPAPDKENTSLRCWD
jgi:hypothetical protein